MTTPWNPERKAGGPPPEKAVGGAQEPQRTNVCMMVANYWGGWEGGAERQCRKQAHALASLGHQVTVLTRWPGPPAARRQRDGETRIVRVGWFEPLWKSVLWLKDRIRPARSQQDGRSRPDMESSLFIKLPERIGFLFPLAYAREGLFMLGMWAWIRANRRRIDVLHVHETHWIAGFAGWLGRRYSIPVAAKVATIPPFWYISKTIPLRSNWAEERKHIHFIALNPPAEAALLETGIPAGQIHIIPNGVTLPGTAAVPAENRNVLFIGNFSQGRLKAFDILFAAWKRVQDHLHRHSLPPAKLVLAGGGDADPWRRMVSAEGMSDSVEFLGFTPEPEKQILRAACLVLPSRFEGMSNALLEAMSFGVPVIVSDIPANTCLVADQINGLVVRAEDPEALAAAILGLLADNSLRATLGAEARRTVETHYDMRAVAVRLARLYRESTRWPVAGGPGTRPPAPPELK